METNENFRKMCQEVAGLLSTESDSAQVESIVYWHMERIARLGGLREVSEALGISRQHAWNQSHKPGFPEPMHSVHATPLWDTEDVKARYKK